MAVRRLLRGQVSWERLEAVGVELADRYDEDELRIEYLDADNWLSTPFVLNEEYFVKLVTDQHALLHALLTTGRNLGAFSAGSEGFFQYFDDPVAMAEHELEATRRIRDIGVNAPAPVEAFGHEGEGIVVLEYLPAFETLDELPPDRASRIAPDLFDALATLHDAGFAHGDLRAENVLIASGELYFIDATSVSPEGIEGARAYDVACALAALEPVIGAAEAVAIAADRYDESVIRHARAFLDFVKIRPDHDFDVAVLKGEIRSALA